MECIRLVDLSIAGKRLLIREDLNVPVTGGEITSDVRIRAALPTIELALERRARIILVSHLGRPEEGLAVTAQPEYSLAPVASRLGELLDRPVPLVADLGAARESDAPIVLLENIRMQPGEKANSDELARKLAELCDIYVMDAFGTAHRAQASTHGVARFADTACAGPLLAAELEALETALVDPRRPVVAVLGGSKVSTKLDVLIELAAKVDALVVGGGIANTFLAAAGFEIGRSLSEADLVPTARDLLKGTRVPLPVDVVTTTELSESGVAELKGVAAVAEEDLIVDIGPQTVSAYGDLLRDAGTIIWNGPVGVFEYDRFAEGTRGLAEAIADSAGFSIAGGGDTLAAIEKFGVTDRISYISTGGGAFLEFVEGKALPAVEILEQRGKT